MRASIVGAVVLGAVGLLGPPAVAADPDIDAAAPRPCLGGTAVCGYVVVPLDRTDPSAGTISIGFELYPHRDTSRPARETIVASEGGPGFATSRSRYSYLELFEPLRDRHDLLLVDNRGTGRSGAINCARLQSYEGSYLAGIADCGRQLGAAAHLYGTGNAADDLTAVLDRLGIDTVNLYGDSYGTYFGQTFAVRHPDRLRALVLDAAYPVEAPDPWYRDTARAANDAFRTTCARNADCTARGGDVVERIRQLLDRLQHGAPVTGLAPDADGRLRDVTADDGTMHMLVTGAATSPTVYRDLDAAGRALIDDGDAAPLLRMVAENSYYGSAGSVGAYSEGLYVAVSCHDYPQPFDMTAPVGVRKAQYTAAVDDLAATDPEGFAPFTVREWVTSPVSEFDSCTVWPAIAPDDLDPPIPPGSTYPDVPVLVLAGHLDSLTSPEGARQVADHFPNSTFVEVANTTHVTALGDNGRCASAIVVRFVRTLDAGDTSCAAAYPEVRMVDDFWAATAAAPPADPAPGDASTVDDRRAVTVAAETVADVMARWWNMRTYDGVGLRGGRFSTVGLSLVRFHLDDVAFTADLTVSGFVTWDRLTGAIDADISLAGATTGDLTLAWVDEPAAVATAQGVVGGRAVAAVLAAP